MPRNIQATTDTGNRDVQLDLYPDHCPLCHYGIEARHRSLAHVSGRRLELVFQCPRSTCQAFFISRYFQTYYPNSQGFFYSGSLPLVPASSRFSETISAMSPLFCEIFSQAQNAENSEWKLVAGPGYRKALEFLVKDYLCQSLPAEAASIKALQLGPCIARFVANEHVKEVSRRAAWLGNDETHYIRRWEDKDLDDLKKLIRLTVHWIDMEETTKSVLNEMPEGKTP